MPMKLSATEKQVVRDLKAISGLPDLLVKMACQYEESRAFMIAEHKESFMHGMTSALLGLRNDIMTFADE